MAKHNEKQVEESKPLPVETPAPMDRSADAGLGFENFDPNKDLKIPFLQIIQGLSPELKRDKAQYIKGADQGDIFNSVTRELYKLGEPEGKPIKIIPCGHIRVHNEWVKRSKNGGYVRTYIDGQEPKTREGMDGDKIVKEVVDNPDHVLVETVMHSVLVLDPKGSYPAIIPMSSSNLAPSRDFTSKLYARKETGKDGKKFTPPSFDNLCELSTVTKKFIKGEAFIYKISIVGRSEDEIYSEAKQVHDVSKDRLTLAAPAAAQLGIEDHSTDDEKTPY